MDGISGTYNPSLSYSVPDNSNSPTTSLARNLSKTDNTEETAPTLFKSNRLTTYFDRAPGAACPEKRLNATERLATETEFWQGKMNQAFTHFYGQLTPDIAKKVESVVKSASGRTAALDDLEHAVVMLHTASLSGSAEEKLPVLKSLASKLADMVLKHGLGATSPLGVSSKKLKAYDKAQQIKNAIAMLADPALPEKSVVLNEVKNEINSYLKSCHIDSGLNAEDIFTTACHILDQQNIINESRKISPFMDLGLSNLLSIQLLSLVKDIADKQSPASDNGQPENALPGNDQPDGTGKMPQDVASDLPAQSGPAPVIYNIDKCVHNHSVHDNRRYYGDDIRNIRNIRNILNKKPLRRAGVLSTPVQVKVKAKAKAKADIPVQRLQTEKGDGGFSRKGNSAVPDIQSTRNGVFMGASYPAVRNPSMDNIDGLTRRPVITTHRPVPEEIPPASGNGDVRHWDVRQGALYRGSPGSSGYQGTILTPGGNRQRVDGIAAGPQAAGNVVSPVPAQDSAFASAEPPAASGNGDVRHWDVRQGALYRGSPGSSGYQGTILTPDGMIADPHVAGDDTSPTMVAARITRGSWHSNAAAKEVNPPPKMVLREYKASKR